MPSPLHANWLRIESDPRFNQLSPQDRVRRLDAMVDSLNERFGPGGVPKLTQFHQNVRNRLLEGDKKKGFFASVGEEFNEAWTNTVLGGGDITPGDSREEGTLSGPALLDPKRRKQAQMLADSEFERRVEEGWFTRDSSVAGGIFGGLGAAFGKAAAPAAVGSLAGPGGTAVGLAGGLVAGDAPESLARETLNNYFSELAKNPDATVEEMEDAFARSAKAGAIAAGLYSIANIIPVGKAATSVAKGIGKTAVGQTAAGRGLQRALTVGNTKTGITRAGIEALKGGVDDAVLEGAVAAGVEPAFGLDNAEQIKGGPFQRIAIAGAAGAGIRAGMTALGKGRAAVDLKRKGEKVTYAKLFAPETELGILGQIDRDILDAQAGLRRKEGSELAEGEAHVTDLKAARDRVLRVWETLTDGTEPIPVETRFDEAATDANPDTAASYNRVNNSITAFLNIFDWNGDEGIARQLLHEAAHAHYETLPANIKAALRELYNAEAGNRAGPLFDAEGKLRETAGANEGINSEQLVGVDPRKFLEWYAERMAYRMDEWAKNKLTRATTPEHGFLNKVFANFRGKLERTGRVLGLEDGLDASLKDFLDAGDRFSLDRGLAQKNYRADRLADALDPTNLNLGQLALPETAGQSGRWANLSNIQMLADDPINPVTGRPHTDTEVPISELANAANAVVAELERRRDIVPRQERQGQLAEAVANADEALSERRQDFLSALPTARDEIRRADLRRAARSAADNLSALREDRLQQGQGGERRVPPTPRDPQELVEAGRGAFARTRPEEADVSPTGDRPTSNAPGDRGGESTPPLSPTRAVGDSPAPESTPQVAPEIRAAGQRAEQALERLAQRPRAPKLQQEFLDAIHAEIEAKKQHLGIKTFDDIDEETLYSRRGPQVTKWLNTLSEPEAINKRGRRIRRLFEQQNGYLAAFTRAGQAYEDFHNGNPNWDSNAIMVLYSQPSKRSPTHYHSGRMYASWVELPKGRDDVWLEAQVRDWAWKDSLESQWLASSTTLSKEAFIDERLAYYKAGSMRKSFLSSSDAAQLGIKIAQYADLHWDQSPREAPKFHLGLSKTNLPDWKHRSFFRRMLRKHNGDIDAIVQDILDEKQRNSIGTRYRGTYPKDPQTGEIAFQDRLELQAAMHDVNMDYQTAMRMPGSGGALYTEIANAVQAHLLGTDATRNVGAIVSGSVYGPGALGARLKAFPETEVIDYSGGSAKHISDPVEVQKRVDELSEAGGLESGNAYFETTSTVRRNTLYSQRGQQRADTLAPIRDDIRRANRMSPEDDVDLELQHRLGMVDPEDTLYSRRVDEQREIMLTEMPKSSIIASQRADIRGLLDTGEDYTYYTSPLSAAMEAFINQQDDLDYPVFSKVFHERRDADEGEFHVWLIPGTAEEYEANRTQWLMDMAADERPDLQPSAAFRQTRHLHTWWERRFLRGNVYTDNPDLREMPGGVAILEVSYNRDSGLSHVEISEIVDPNSTMRNYFKTLVKQTDGNTRLIADRLNDPELREKAGSHPYIWLFKNAPDFEEQDVAEALRVLNLDSPESVRNEVGIGEALYSEAATVLRAFDQDILEGETYGAGALGVRRKVFGPGNTTATVPRMRYGGDPRRRYTYRTDAGLRRAAAALGRAGGLETYEKHYLTESQIDPDILYSRRSKKRVSDQLRRFPARAGQADPQLEAIRARREDIREKGTDAQNLKDVAADVAAMSNAELDAIVAATDTDGIKIQGGVRNNVVRAHEERLVRAQIDGDSATVEHVFEKLSKMGTTVGQLLRQFREIKGRYNSAEHYAANRLALIKLAFRKKGLKMPPKLEAEVKRLIADEDRTQSEFTSAYDAYLKDTTNREAYKAARKAEAAEELAFRKLVNTIKAVTPRQSLWNDLVTVMQGNLLTSVSTFRNFGGNYMSVLPRTVMRVPAASADAFYSAVTGKPRTIAFPSLMEGAWFLKGWVRGHKRAAKNFIHGSTEDVVLGEEVRGFHPAQALYRATRGLFNAEESLLPVDINTGKVRKRDRVAKLFEAIFGAAPEVMLRSLSSLDEGAKEAFRSMRAAEEARLRGFKRGSKEYGEAEFRRGDGVGKVVKEAAEETALSHTYQNDSQPAKIVQSLENAISSVPGFGSMLRFLYRVGVSPYVRTPINLVHEGTKWALPAYGIAHGMMKAKQGNRREAQLSFSYALGGVIVGAWADWLEEQGIISGGPESGSQGTGARTVRDESGFGFFRFNFSGFLRAWQGQDPKFRPGDTTFRLDTLGVIGYVLATKAEAKRMYRSDPKSIPPEWAQGIPGAVELSRLLGPTSFAIDQSVLQGVSSLNKAMEGGENAINRWAGDKVNQLSALAMPNELQSILLTLDSPEERAFRPKLVDPDDWTQTVENVLRYKFLWSDRDQLPVRRGIFGRPLEATPEGQTPEIFHLINHLKTEKIRNDTPALIARLYADTQDMDVIPSVVGRQMKWRDVDINLPADLYDSLYVAVQGAKGDAYEKGLQSSGFKSAYERDPQAAVKILAHISEQQGNKAKLKWQRDNMRALDKYTQEVVRFQNKRYGNR